MEGDEEVEILFEAALVSTVAITLMVATIVTTVVLVILC
jgi:hypothetical protein